MLTEKCLAIMEQLMSLFKLDTLDTPELSVLDLVQLMEPLGLTQCSKALQERKPSLSKK